MIEPTDKRQRLIGLAFPAMVGLRVLGAALSPLLFAHLPILLIAMSPFLIHLVAVAPLVSPAAYFPVALVITTAQAALGFLFGYTYGQRALSWLLDRIPIPDTVVERCLAPIRKASVPAIFAIPGPVLGVTAGVAGVRPRTFAICVAPAQALWVTAAYLLGQALLVYIEIARNFVIDHAFVLTGATITIVALRWLFELYRRRKRRRKDSVD